MGRLDESTGQVVPPKLDAANEEEYQKTIDAMDSAAPGLEQVAEKAMAGHHAEVLKYFKLLEHGQAPYKFQANGSKSYYARLRHENGAEEVVWGVDIERALQEAKASQGDVVTLAREGQKPVTIKERQHDGQIIEKQGYRNAWRAEVLDDQEAGGEEDSQRECPRG